MIIIDIDDISMEYSSFARVMGNRYEMYLEGLDALLECLAEKVYSLEQEVAKLKIELENRSTQKEN